MLNIIKTCKNILMAFLIFFLFSSLALFVCEAQDSTLINCPGWENSYIKNGSFECCNSLSDFKTWSITNPNLYFQLAGWKENHFRVGWYPVGDYSTENADYFRFFSNKQNIDNFFYIPTNKMNNFSSDCRMRYPIGASDYYGTVIVDSSELAYIGINTHYPHDAYISFEFIQQKLKQAMLYGERYECKFYVSKNMISDYSHKIAAVFSHEPIGFGYDSTNNSYYRMPSDTIKKRYHHWRVAGGTTGRYEYNGGAERPISIISSKDEISATGGDDGLDDWVEIIDTFFVEDIRKYFYITIGCFERNDDKNITKTNTSYYIDNVSIKQLQGCEDCDDIAKPDSNNLYFQSEIRKIQDECCYEYYYKYSPDLLAVSLGEFGVEIPECDLSGLKIKIDNSLNYSAEHEYRHPHDTATVPVDFYCGFIKLEEPICFDISAPLIITDSIMLLRENDMDTCIFTRTHNIENCIDIPDCDCDSNSFTILAPGKIDDHHSISYNYDILVKLGYCDYDSIHIFVDNILHERIYPIYSIFGLFEQGSEFTLEDKLQFSESEIQDTNTKEIRLEFYNRYGDTCSVFQSIDFDTLCINDCNNLDFGWKYLDSSCCYELFISNSGECDSKLEKIKLAFGNENLANYIVGELKENGSSDHINVPDTSNTGLTAKEYDYYQVWIEPDNNYIAIPAQADSFVVATLCLFDNSSATTLEAEFEFDDLYCENSVPPLTCEVYPCLCDNELEGIEDLYVVELIHRQEFCCYDLICTVAEQPSCDSIAEVIVLNSSDTIFTNTDMAVINQSEFTFEWVSCFDSNEHKNAYIFEVVFKRQDGTTCSELIEGLIECSCECHTSGLDVEAIPSSLGSCCYDMVATFDYTNCTYMLNKINLQTQGYDEFFNWRKIDFGSELDNIDVSSFGDTISYTPNDDSLCFSIGENDSLFLGRYCMEDEDTITFIYEFYDENNILCWNGGTTIEPCNNCDSNSISIATTYLGSITDVIGKHCKYEISIDITDSTLFDFVEIAGKPNFKDSSASNVTFIVYVDRGLVRTYNLLFTDSAGNIICKKTISLGCEGYRKPLEADEIVHP